jgi:hypothetical protein
MSEKKVMRTAKFHDSRPDEVEVMSLDYFAKFTIGADQILVWLESYSSEVILKQKKSDYDNDPAFDIHYKFVEVKKVKKIQREIIHERYDEPEITTFTFEEIKSTYIPSWANLILDEVGRGDRTLTLQKPESCKGTFVDYLIRFTLIEEEVIA